MQTHTITPEMTADQVVHDFLTAVQQGNHPKAIDRLHPNIVWNQPGHNRFSGTKQSRDEVVGMLGGMIGFTAKTLTLTHFDRLSVNGNRVSCVVHWRAVEEAGGRLDVDNIDQYTVSNGQIVEATIFSADLAQEDAFWPK